MWTGYLPRVIRSILMETKFPAEVVKDATLPNAWRVEKLDSDQDGGIDQIEECALAVPPFDRR
jgi:hypothetical protein